MGHSLQWQGELNFEDALHEAVVAHLEGRSPEEAIRTFYRWQFQWGQLVVELKDGV